jgi:hypothetical protein
MREDQYEYGEWSDAVKDNRAVEVVPY